MLRKLATLSFLLIRLECSFFVLTFPSLFLLDTNFMKNQEIIVILGNADKRDWYFILIQLLFKSLGRRDRLFKTYFRFNKIQDNPFRIMNLMLLIFIVLWLGYINYDFLISSFSSLGIFTFFYYQNIPMKSLLKRMFLIGCGLLFAFVLGILSTYVLWLEPFAVALVAFSSRFVLRLFHISKPGGLFLRCFLPWERVCSCQSLNYRSSRFIFLWVSFLP